MSKYNLESTDQLRELLTELNYEGTVILENPSYITALVGITDTGQLVYDFDEMVEYLMTVEDMSEEDALDFISYNTMRALPYMGDLHPIIVNPLPFA